MEKMFLAGMMSGILLSMLVDYLLPYTLHIRLIGGRWNFDVTRKDKGA
jgi:hypothetical protein